jgi:putative transposase
VIAKKETPSILPGTMNDIPFLVRLIAATVLAKQNKFLMAEIGFHRVEIARLHEELPKGHKLRFTDAWRKRLARAATGVGWKRLAEIATVAKGETIRGWHRLMVKGKLGLKRNKVGHPKTSEEIEALVVRMATENLWGQHRISGELHKLGIRLCPRTVQAILKRHGLEPEPARRTAPTWKTFISEKMGKLAATDFFTAEVMSWLGPTTYYVLFAIHLATRKVHIVGISENPNEAFMVQTARNDTMTEVGWLKQVGAEYLIHDGDTTFSEQWKNRLKIMSFYTTRGL